MTKRIPNDLIPPRVAFMVSVRFSKQTTEDEIRTKMYQDYKDYVNEFPEDNDPVIEGYVQFCIDAAVQMQADLLEQKAIAIAFDPADDPELAHMISHVMESNPGNAPFKVLKMPVSGSLTKKEMN